MRLKPMVFFGLFFFFASVSSPPAQLKKVRLSVSAAADDVWMKGAIEFPQKSFDGADKEVPTKQVFDFSVVQKAAR
jgi:hypothetical protein